MKIISINSIKLCILLICIWSCKAQILPLNTALSNIPNNAYVKDLDGQLNLFIGTYKANFNGNEITLYITADENKLMNYGNQIFYRDALVIKYIVQNPSGTILQDTQYNNNPTIELYSTKTKSADSSVIFYYSGTNCGVGWGDIFLKKISDTQISWEYRPNDILIDRSKCPQGTDITIYLPETKDLIFTKQ